MHFSKLLAEAVHSNAEFDPKWETTMSLGDHRCELAAGGDLDVFGSADLRESHVTARRPKMKDVDVLPTVWRMPYLDE